VREALDGCLYGLRRAIGVGRHFVAYFDDGAPVLGREVFVGCLGYTGESMSAIVLVCGAFMNGIRAADKQCAPVSDDVPMASSKGPGAAARNILGSVFRAQYIRICCCCCCFFSPFLWANPGYISSALLVFSIGMSRGDEERFGGCDGVGWFEFHLAAAWRDGGPD
jgi:hypothetical protein